MDLGGCEKWIVWGEEIFHGYEDGVGRYSFQARGYVYTKCRSLVSLSIVSSSALAGVYQAGHSLSITPSDV